MNRKRHQFDWQAIHAELDRRLSYLGASVEDDADRVHELLRERSVALAAGGNDGHAQKRLTRMMVFRLGAERFALSLDCAREVTELSRAAVVPGAGAGIHGIVNWRGEFVVVCDLGQLLGVAAAEDGSQRRVIVLRGDEPLLALAVDAVEQVIPVDLTSLQGRDHMRTKNIELFRGVTADAVSVLDVGNLMSRLKEELRAA